MAINTPPWQSKLNGNNHTNDEYLAYCRNLGFERYPDEHGFNYGSFIINREPLTTFRAVTRSDPG